MTSPSLRAALSRSPTVRCSGNLAPFRKNEIVLIAGILLQVSFFLRFTIQPLTLRRKKGRNGIFSTPRPFMIPARNRFTLSSLSSPRRCNPPRARTIRRCASSHSYSRSRTCTALRSRHTTAMSTPGKLPSSTCSSVTTISSSSFCHSSFS